MVDIKLLKDAKLGSHVRTDYGDLYMVTELPVYNDITRVWCFMGKKLIGGIYLPDRIVYTG